MYAALSALCCSNDSTAGRESEEVYSPRESGRLPTQSKHISRAKLAQPKPTEVRKRLSECVTGMRKDSGTLKIVASDAQRRNSGLIGTAQPGMAVPEKLRDLSPSKSGLQAQCAQADAGSYGPRELVKQTPIQKPVAKSKAKKSSGGKRTEHQELKQESSRAHGDKGSPRGNRGHSSEARRGGADVNEEVKENTSEPASQREKPDCVSSFPATLNFFSLAVEEGLSSRGAWRLRCSQIARSAEGASS